MEYVVQEGVATHQSKKIILQHLQLLNMKSWVLNNKLLIAGIILGAIGGYLYWQQIGCSSGTCAITSKWHNSTAYGALMGGLLFSMFKKEKNADNKQ
jgi:Family of unknown function (DUF6132)